MPRVWPRSEPITISACRRRAGGVARRSPLVERVTARRYAGGDLGLARDLLGHPFLVEGRVVTGDRRGRELGYPTANLRPGPRGLWPANGIYAVRATWGTGKPVWHDAVASLGVRPTFGAATGCSKSICSSTRSICTVGACAGLHRAPARRDNIRHGRGPQAQMHHDGGPCRSGGGRALSRAASTERRSGASLTLR